MTSKIRKKNKMDHAKLNEWRRKKNHKYKNKIKIKKEKKILPIFTPSSTSYLGNSILWRERENKKCKKRK